MDPNELKNTTQNVSENEEETELLRRELTGLYLQGRVPWSTRVINSAKLEHLREMKSICCKKSEKLFPELYGKDCLRGVNSFEEG